MYFQFLIEDQSGGVLIEAIMQKVIGDNNNVTYDIKPFRGIGGFTQRNTVKETKTGKLLNDLATYLRGFNKSLSGIPAAIIVIVDNDYRETIAFQSQLKQVALTNLITIDHIFCIAVEEIEAWLLGDEEAVLTAYPRAKQQVLNAYVQDSICGTWEVLSDAVYPGGLNKMRKECSSYIEKGKQKAEWAKNIGIHMDLDANRSPSFNYFITELYRRIVPVV